MAVVLLTVVRLWPLGLLWLLLLLWLWLWLRLRLWLRRDRRSGVLRLRITGGCRSGYAGPAIGAIGGSVVDMMSALDAVHTYPLVLLATGVKSAEAG